MNKLAPFLLLELRGLFGLNRLLHTRDPKAKKRGYLLLGVMLFAALAVCSYIGGFVYGLCMLGAADLVPTYLITVTSIMILMFGVFRSGWRIFSSQGYDLLAALPIKTVHLVLSRMLGLYLEDLCLTLLVLLPGCITYGVFAAPEPCFYAAAGCLGVFLPILPQFLSLMISTLMMALSARCKHKNLFQILFAVSLVIAVMVLSFSAQGFAQSLTPEVITELLQNGFSLIASFFPPAAWLGDALTAEKLWPILLYALFSMLAAAGMLLLLTKAFHPTVQALSRTHAAHNYKLTAMASSTLRKALLFRECKRYFASPIYVTNTIIGPILAAIAAIALAVVGVERIPAELPFDIKPLLPYAVAMILTMMTTTSVSISMEGRQFALIKSLPIPAKALFEGKMLLDLTLLLPGYLISVIALGIALKPDLLSLLWIILIPLAVSLFAVVFGIFINLRSCSFDWEKEETVVKQSLSAMLGGFSGPIVSILGAGSSLLPGGYSIAAKACFIIALLFITWLLYRKNAKTDLTAIG